MIISRTPLRISFSGGGSDLYEHYSLHGGAVLSTAINKYVYITVNKSFDDRIRVSYSKTEITYDVEKIQHPIVREALKLTGITKGIEITSIADVPGGTGLGSSSGFTVGLLNALYAFKGVMQTAHQLAEESSHIEIDLVGEPIGKQDQFIAAYGGLQFITFNSDESIFVDPVICPLEMKKELNANLLLFYTGKTRDAGSILAKQKTTLTEKSQMLNQMEKIAKSMREVLQSGKSLVRFGELLNESWHLKKTLSNAISNPELDNYYNQAISAGALGGKILGAGGGGFFLFYVERQKQKLVQEALRDLRKFEFEFEPQGSKIIYVG